MRYLLFGAGGTQEGEDDQEAKEKEETSLACHPKRAEFTKRENVCVWVRERERERERDLVGEGYPLVGLNSVKMRRNSALAFHSESSAPSSTHLPLFLQSALFLVSFPSFLLLLPILRVLTNSTKHFPT